jgi:DnaJ-class molecular chaperone
VNYTHYDYLDLAPGASPTRIDAAYRQVLERFGYGSTDSGQDLSGMVRLIHAAYETLSNPQARSAYDAKLAQEAAMADAELKAALDREAMRPSRYLPDTSPALSSAVGALAA